MYIHTSPLKHAQGRLIFQALTDAKEPFAWDSGLHGDSAYSDPFFLEKLIVYNLLGVGCPHRSTSDHQDDMNHF